MFNASIVLSCVYSIAKRVIVCCFFFQAEDGIRDLVRSRGLGDVYKRQTLAPAGDHVALERIDLGALHSPRRRGVPLHVPVPVSYTHLTLPTSDLV